LERDDEPETAHIWERACTTLQNGSLDNLDRVKGQLSIVPGLLSIERKGALDIIAGQGLAILEKGFSSTETSAVHERL